MCSPLIKLHNQPQGFSSAPLNWITTLNWCIKAQRRCWRWGSLSWAGPWGTQQRSSFSSFQVMLLSAQGVFILFFDEAKGKSEGTAGFFNIFSIVLCFIQKGRASPGPCFSRGAVVLLFSNSLQSFCSFSFTVPGCARPGRAARWWTPTTTRRWTSRCSACPSLASQAWWATTWLSFNLPNFYNTRLK